MITTVFLHRNNSDETLEHDQNTDTNQQQKTDSKFVHMIVALDLP